MSLLRFLPNLVLGLFSMYETIVAVENTNCCLMVIIDVNEIQVTG